MESCFLQPLGKKEIILNNQDVLYFEGELVLDQIIGSFKNQDSPVHCSFLL